jgi:DNA-binding MarR family transcriptional regulator
VPATRWLDPAEQRLWRLFLQSHAQLTAELGRELQDDADLSVQDYAVLVALSESAGGTMRAFELSEQLAWEKSRLSHHITRMIARDLVTRRQCPTDKRGAFVAITKFGRRALRAAAPGHVASVRSHFIDLLTPKELEMLTAVSEKVLRALEKCDDSVGASS